MGKRNMPPLQTDFGRADLTPLGLEKSLWRLAGGDRSGRPAVHIRTVTELFNSGVRIVNRFIRARQIKSE
jgi:hypothetical protein